MNTFYSNGKLLLTGEYVVLDGALSLAIPTFYGQSLIVEPINEHKLLWQSLDYKGNVWFEEEFLFEQIAPSNPLLSNEDSISKRIVQILNEAKKNNPEFLVTEKGFKIMTKLDFSRDWGLGTSSTLINNIANWANVDAYKLLELTFGGSGYDIACAQHNSPVTYKLINKTRTVEPINFNPTFKDHLYFVYLNKKQNSRDGIATYRLNTSNLTKPISKISNITSKLMSCESLSEFDSLIETHEQIIGSIINQKPIKSLLFNDFNGSIKSLGAWGGDFALVSSQDDPKAYFEAKGFKTIIAYDDMVLNQKEPH